jgi:hypothetical protein
MKADKSVASMTNEQIAESLEITPRCLASYERQEAFPEDRQALSEGAAIIRAGSSRGFDVALPIQRLAALADLMDGMPAWQKRVLVYRRAVSILEQMPA